MLIVYIQPREHVLETVGLTFPIRQYGVDPTDQISCNYACHLAMCSVVLKKTKEQKLRNSPEQKRGIVVSYDKSYP